MSEYVGKANTLPVDKNRSVTVSESEPPYLFAMTVTVCESTPCGMSLVLLVSVG